MSNGHVYFMNPPARVALRAVTARIDDQVRGEGQSPPSDESNERAWYRAYDAAQRVFAQCDCDISEEWQAQRQAASHHDWDGPDVPDDQCPQHWPEALKAARQVVDLASG